MKNITKILPICLCLILFGLSHKALWARTANTGYDNRIYTRATIKQIEKKEITEDKSSGILETRIYLEILDGELKGQIKTAVFSGESDLPKDMHYQEGQTVFIGISKLPGGDVEEYISLYDIDNTFGIIIMGSLLLISIVIIGRIKGLFSLLALIVTIMLLFLVLIPLTLKGFSPLPIAVCIAIISIIITLPIIAGRELKTLAAILGACAGIVFSTILALLFGWTMHLSGVVTNEMLTLFYAASAEINLHSLALSGMIIAALGAIMDVCISIASSTAEIFRANPSISVEEAYKSVINIGTDILGSMVNTLILAYVGSSFSLILLISMRIEPEMPLGMILNYNPVLSELVKSAVGSIGMFLCIPITALISVRMFKKRSKSLNG